MADIAPTALLPELLLLLGALVVLLSGSFLPRRRLGLTRTVTLVVLLASGVAAAVALAQPSRTVFSDSYAVDTATGAARLVAVVAAAVVVLLSADEVRGNPRQAETYALVLLGTLGTLLLAGAHDLLVVVTGFLLASIPLYALVGMAFTARASEAAMKTYLYGSLFGIVLLAGVTVLFGVGGATAYTDLRSGLLNAPGGAVAFGLVAVLGGLLFKAGGVPAHFWVVDAVEGSSVLAASFLTTVPKLGALVAAYRLVLVVPGTAHPVVLVGVLAVASMTLGNLAAFAQTDPRRLLGWSTVSQVGYLLVPVAVAGRSPLALGALLVYLAGYALTNLAAFAVLAAHPRARTLADWVGLARRDHWLGAALLVSLLGLVGTPPTAVFVGKLAVASAAWDGGAGWLSVAVLANSVLSLFYYLRWLAPAFVADGAGPDPGRRAGGAARTAVTVAALSLVAGLAAAALFSAFGGGLVG